MNKKKDNNEKLVVAKTYTRVYSTVIEAELDKALLKSHKIPCILKKDPMRPHLPSILLVKVKDYKKAKTILERK